MTISDVVKISTDALYVIVVTSAPVLVVSLVVGLIVSIFQTVTSIQEQTLTFVPKVVGIFTAMMLVGHWMLNSLITFMQDLWTNFSLYIR